LNKIKREETNQVWYNDPSYYADLLPQQRDCFACGKRLKYRTLVAWTEDGTQWVYVGRECYGHIIGAVDGYQPPLGGPKLYSSNPKKAD
jgi:hypothetical protein